jgi:hypothetical protein
MFFMPNSEHLLPYSNNNGVIDNWELDQPYWNCNSHPMNGSYHTPTPPRTVADFSSKQNGIWQAKDQKNSINCSFWIHFIVSYAIACP